MFCRSANDSCLFFTPRSPLLILVFVAATNYRPQLKSVNRNNEFLSYHSGIREDSSLPDVTQERGAKSFKGQTVEEEQNV